MLCLLGGAGVVQAFPFGGDDTGGVMVYTMSNDAAANQIIAYRLGANGVLNIAATVATGGRGLGAGLGSQGAVVLSQGNRWLLAVNPGSNDVSVFRVSGESLTLASKTASGGTQPLSVTISGGIVYVLNAGVPNNITGFKLGNDGSLTPIANSTKALSAGSVGPAQVQFTSDGARLIVTEKNTNLIDVFPVRDGVAGTRVTTPSKGLTPFGFALDRHDRVFVSEAAGGAAGASTVTSYDIASNSALDAITAALPTAQGAACWVSVHPTGRWAYVSNTASRTVTVLNVSRDGSFNLQPGLGFTPAGGTLDTAFSPDGRNLYALTGDAASIVVFHVNADGSLTALHTNWAPAAAAGLAAQ